MFATFGPESAGVGDVNGDGYSDFIASVLRPGVVPRVLLFLGSGVGLADFPAAELQPPAAYSRSFGSAGAGGGDCNGDGLSDVLIGTPEPAESGSTAAGHVFEFRGATFGLPTDAQRDLSPSLSTLEDGYGASVSLSGDIDGDGYADAVIAAPRIHQVFVHRGSSTGITPTAAVVLRAPSTGPFGQAVRH